MFKPVEALRDNPALFACYVLFVYFRGRNAVRIEREMRGLGHTTFHRRNLYPRGRQPGWIARYGWQQLSVPPAVAGGSTRTIDPPGIPANSTDLSQEGRFTPAPSTKNSGGKPAFPTEICSDARSAQPPDIPHSAIRTPHSNDFHAWLKCVAPTMTWDWKHQQVIIEQLKKVTTGDCKRLMIFLPPRHGKTELVSVRYTAWRMQQTPSMNVILGSYNQRLADRMSRKIRTAICDAESIRLGKGGNPTGREGVGVQPQMNADKRRSDIPKESEDKDISVHPRPSAVGSFEDGSPFPFSRPRPKNAVSEWETATGGSFRAVGAGSGVTGFGANLIVIDDPVKNRAQAESETYRNRVWDWYKDDLYTRLEPDGSIVLIQTRWHEDDLAGRLLRDDLDNWTIINLPALSEPQEMRNADRGMRNEEPEAETRQPTSVPPAVAGGCSQPIEAPGKPAFPTETVSRDQSTQPLEIPQSAFRNPHSMDWRQAPNIALCPERFDIDALEQQRRQLGTYSFSALYQQRPTPAGGQIFKREWFKNIIDFAPPGLRWTRGYDLAVSTRTESDYTASFRVAFDDKSGNMYISGGFRRRIEFPEQRRFIIDRMLSEPNTDHGVELALHGQALLQDLRRDPALRGKSLKGVKVSTDKLTRALAWSPLAEEGKVILVRNAEFGMRNEMHKPAREQGLYQDSAAPHHPCDTEISPRLELTQRNPIAAATDIPHSAFRIPHSPWIEDLLDELSAFPNGSHDDQIDAISLAVQLHAHKPKRAGGMLVT